MDYTKIVEEINTSAIGFCLIMIAMGYSISLVVRSFAVFKKHEVNEVVSSPKTLEDRVNDLLIEIDDIRENITYHAGESDEIEEYEGKLADRQKVLDLYLRQIELQKN